MRDGAEPASLPALLRSRARQQRTTYRQQWLGMLWQQAGDPTPADYICRGWDEFLDVLDRLDLALTLSDDGEDACRITGAGWIAEEALATGLFCAIRHAEDPVTALSRAAATSGDSDSIACLTGAFLGASLGMTAWPAHWQDQIEYADQLFAWAGRGTDLWP